MTRCRPDPDRLTRRVLRIDHLPCRLLAAVPFALAATASAGVPAKPRSIVSVLACGAVGDGAHDDSAAIQACIDQNRGATIILPAGRTFLAAGIVLDGAPYDGTTIIVAGTLLLKPSGGRLSAPWPIWGGIIVHKTHGVTIDVPGMMDGNRTRQAPHEQHHLLSLWGAVDTAVPHFRGREVRGDGIMVTTGTSFAPFADNTVGLTIGTVDVRNTADDGRNAVSIVSGERIVIAQVTSDRVGGVIAGRRMPGGVDLETDGNWQRIRNVRIGRVAVRTIGDCGVAVIGSAVTTDAAEDWTIDGVTFGDVAVTNAPDGRFVGAPIIRRARNIRITGSEVQVVRGQGWTFDFVNGLDADIRSRGTRDAAILGYGGFVRDARMRIDVADHSGAAVLAGGVTDSDIRIRERGPQGAASFALRLTRFGRSVTQTGVTYGIDAPDDPQRTAAVVNHGVTMGRGTRIVRVTLPDGARRGAATAP